MNKAQVEATMTLKQRIAIIGTGLGDTGADIALHPALQNAAVVIGGRALLERFTPSAARKIVIAHDIESVLAQAEALFNVGEKIAVLASGDPLFFGIGGRFAQRFGIKNIDIYPATSSLQLAAARLGLPWAEVCAVSLHGRESFLPLAHALMDGGPVCLLTDATHSPNRAARFMLERGAVGYAVHVFANLGEMPQTGNEPLRKIPVKGTPGLESRNESVCQAAGETRWAGSLAEAAGLSFPTPNVVFFVPDKTLPTPLPLCPGQTDESFIHERGLITKWPVRATALAALRIEQRHTVWDLGAGAGSVAIEAASLARRGLVLAVEKDFDRVAHIKENRRRFGATNLEIVHGELPACLHIGHAEHEQEQNPNGLFTGLLPQPDRVFIGGGLGGDPVHARETLRAVWERIAPGGRLVIACVLLSGMENARHEMESWGTVDVTLVQTSHSMPLGSSMRLEAHNPVFIMACAK